MAVYYGADIWTESITHYGIKGQKWGTRRFQNENGTLTQQGKIRYSSGYTKSSQKSFYTDRSSGGGGVRVEDKIEEIKK